MFQNTLLQCNDNFLFRLKNVGGSTFFDGPTFLGSNKNVGQKNVGTTIWGGQIFGGAETELSACNRKAYAILLKLLCIIILVDLSQNHGF